MQNPESQVQQPFGINLDMTYTEDFIQHKKNVSDANEFFLFQREYIEHDVERMIRRYKTDIYIISPSSFSNDFDKNIELLSSNIPSEGRDYVIDSKKSQSLRPKSADSYQIFSSDNPFNELEPAILTEDISESQNNPDGYRTIAETRVFYSGIPSRGIKYLCEKYGDDQILVEYNQQITTEFVEQSKIVDEELIRRRKKSVLMDILVNTGIACIPIASAISLSQELINKNVDMSVTLTVTSVLYVFIISFMYKRFSEKIENEINGLTLHVVDNKKKKRDISRLVENDISKIDYFGIDDKQNLTGSN